MTMNSRQHVQLVRPNAASREAELVNPVESLWSITLHYGRFFAYSQNSYSIQFKSKLIGEDSKSYLFVDLEEDFDRILKELNVFGVMTRADLLRSIDYATQLKIRGEFVAVPDLLPFIQGQAKDSESAELYARVVDFVSENSELFPTVSGGEYNETRSLGVLLDTDSYVRKFGESVVGVSTEGLYEALELDSSNSKRLVEITRTWHQTGYLVKKSNQSRLQEAVRPIVDVAMVKRFYLIKLNVL